MAIENIDHYIESLPKERRDWLEVFGNQWGHERKKQMPGTCEACVWGRGHHTEECVRVAKFDALADVRAALAECDRQLYKDALKADKFLAIARDYCSTPRP